MKEKRSLFFMRQTPFLLFLLILQKIYISFFKKEKKHLWSIRHEKDANISTYLNQKTKDKEHL